MKKEMTTDQLATAFLDWFDYLIANWQKKKKGVDHHVAKQIAREALMKAALRTPRPQVYGPDKDQ